MPPLEFADVEYPSLERLTRAFYLGSLRDYIPKLYDDFYLCPEPLEYIRLFQLIMRPTWAMPYATRTTDFKRLRDGLLRIFEHSNARFVQHPAHESVQEENVIRLSLHSHGRNSQTWHYKAAYLPHMLHFDRDGYSGWSELYKAPGHTIRRIPAKVASPYFKEVQREYAASRISKYKQAEKSDVAQSDYVFVALQLPNDSVARLKLFPQPYVEAMQIAISGLVNGGVPVVVKRHPRCTDPAVETMLASFSSPLFQTSSASIHDLIPPARCVLTMNSGVGFEALLYEKPVVCLGKADYAQAGKECADPALVPETVEAAIRELDRNFIHKLIFAAYNIYQLDTRSDKAFERQVLRALCWNYAEKAAR